MKILLHILTDEPFWLGFTGWLLQSLLKSKAIQDDARRNKVQYKFTEYFTSDWLTHLISFVCIFIAAWKVDEIHHLVPAIEEMLGFFFIAIGASGGMIVSYIIQFVVSKVSFIPNSLSVATRVNEAVAYKTQIANDVNGTVEPTPKAPK